MRNSGRAGCFLLFFSSIAYDLYPVDREASQDLLSNLERANPTRPEAFFLRQRLFDQEN
ncbi:MAG: hypothetical protein Q3M24_01570 [Candidatus Electrothrix aestuarii]|uniref:Uncharacterized protein n=1 Tax=Candidatus Electrothrix aestuarii TaxID=3062594 RepID=A0AAU8LWI8_9BACT|nr:hypothetical protein [Candidatus Electrothrix aestuarii]